MVLKKISFVLILAVNVAWSSSGTQGKKLLVHLQNNLEVQKSKVSKLKASIRSIENEIGKKNSTYLMRLEQLKKLDNIKIEMNNELSFNNDLIDKEQERIRTIVAKLVGNSLTQDLEQTYEKAVLKNVIEQRAQKLSSYKSNNQNIQDELTKVNQKIEMIKGIEQDLYSAIINMENRKGGLARKYLVELDEKDNLEKQLSRHQLEVATRKMEIQKNNKKFELPIKNYLRYKLERKGMSFIYKGEQAVFASNAGTVIYTGKLASYGNVVMIDHGDNIRSVMLGRLKLKIKKGDYIKAGAIIANTFKTSKKDNLYFEIRKSNKAQKVLSFLNFSKDLVKI